MTDSIRRGALVAIWLACWTVPVQADDGGESFPVKSKDGASCNVPAVCRAFLSKNAAENSDKGKVSLAAHCKESDEASADSAHCNTRYLRYRICALYERKPEMFRNSSCNPGQAQP